MTPHGARAGEDAEDRIDDVRHERVDDRGERRAGALEVEQPSWQQRRRKRREPEA